MKNVFLTALVVLMSTSAFASEGQTNDWYPETLASATSLVNCFDVYNGQYNQLVQERSDLQLSLNNPSISLTSSQRLDITSKVLNIGSRLAIMDSKYAATRVYKSGNDKFNKMANLCRSYGVELIKE